MNLTKTQKGGGSVGLGTPRKKCAKWPRTGGEGRFLKGQKDGYLGGASWLWGYGKGVGREKKGVQRRPTCPEVKEQEERGGAVHQWLKTECRTIKDDPGRN